MTLSFNLIPVHACSLARQYLLGAEILIINHDRSPRNRSASVKPSHCSRYSLSIATRGDNKTTALRVIMSTAPTNSTSTEDVAKQPLVQMSENGLRVWGFLHLRQKIIGYLERGKQREIMALDRSTFDVTVPEPNRVFIGGVDLAKQFDSVSCAVSAGFLSGRQG